MPAELTLRRDSSGGGAVPEIRGTRAAFQERRRIVLLVHGFNVSEDEARASFARFERQLARASLSRALNVIRVYWPGDERLPVWSELSYPLQVGRAREIAPLLADYLREVRGPNGETCDVFFVAHSLGCRLVLETLSALAGAPPSDRGRAIRAVVLMAAAVPVPHVQAGGPLAACVKGLERVVVLYSPKDSALGKVFSAGQRAARGDGGWTEAVGLRGAPSRDVWGGREHMRGFDHSDYWPSASVAELVSAELRAVRAAPPPPHVPPVRATPVRTPHYAYRRVAWRNVARRPPPG